MPSRTSTRRRRVETRDPRKRFLIVCEGGKTEPLYFEGFRSATRVLRIEGLGANTLSLVERVIALRDEDDYDEVWCVFDRDSFPAETVNAALARASNEGLRVAFSNEAFEIWYLLHFNFYDAALSRSQYADKLTRLLGRPYRKNDVDMYRFLEPRQAAAIRNAKRLLERYHPRSPSCDNPSTTVHILVEALLEQV